MTGSTQPHHQHARPRLDRVQVTIFRVITGQTGDEPMDLTPRMRRGVLAAPKVRALRLGHRVIRQRGLADGPGDNNSGWHEACLVGHVGGLPDR